MARYCTNCYLPASEEDVFCKGCGQPLAAKCEKKTESVPFERTEELLPMSEVKNEPKKDIKDEAVVSTEEKVPVISLGEWVWSTLLCFIPLVGLIMLIIWSATAETNPNKKNFARAMLIWKAVEILLSIIFFTMIMAAVVAFGSYSRGFMF